MQSIFISEGDKLKTLQFHAATVIVEIGIEALNPRTKNLFLPQFKKDAYKFLVNSMHLAFPLVLTPPR